MKNGSKCCGGRLIYDGSYKRPFGVEHRESCEFYLRRCCPTVARVEVGHIEGCYNDPGLAPPQPRAAQQSPSEVTP